MLKSSYEYPGRYSRWTVGFTAPAVQIEGTGLDFSITPLNERGEVILKMLAPRIESEKATFEFIKIGADHSIVGKITNSTYYFAEEERSKQPSLFSLIRIITSIMSSPDSGQFGLYGAFGYDLAYQFEKIELKKARNSEQRDLVLYLPDEILIVDNQKGDAWCIKYELEDPKAKLSTRGIPRANSLSPFERASDENWMQRDLPKGTYAKQVVQAKNEFRVGNLFEVVISQTFREKLGPKTLPSQIFSRFVVYLIQSYFILFSIISICVDCPLEILLLMDSL